MKRVDIQPGNPNLGISRDGKTATVVARVSNLNVKPRVSDERFLHGLRAWAWRSKTVEITGLSGRPSVESPIKTFWPATEAMAVRKAARKTISENDFGAYASDTASAGLFEPVNGAEVRLKYSRRLSATTARISERLPNPAAATDPKHPSVIGVPQGDRGGFSVYHGHPDTSKADRLNRVWEEVLARVRVQSDTPRVVFAASGGTHA